MSSARRALFALAALLSLAIAGCGDDPPTKEIQQAQAAIDSARTAGADQYDHEEFAGAQEALQHSNEAVGQRDYRLALHYALDARERAQTAEKDSGDRKISARTDAVKALTDVNTELNDARAKLKAAEAARAPAKIVGDARRVITDSDRALQKARAEYGQGNYLAVTKMAAETGDRLRATSRTLDTVLPPSAHRRH
jgi:hypothetical protein